MKLFIHLRLKWPFRAAANDSCQVIKIPFKVQVKWNRNVYWVSWSFPNKHVKNIWNKMALTIAECLMLFSALYPFTQVFKSLSSGTFLLLFLHCPCGPAPRNPNAVVRASSHGKQLPLCPSFSSLLTSCFVDLSSYWRKLNMLNNKV